MTTEPPTPEAAAEGTPETPSMVVPLTYAGASAVTTAQGKAELALFANLRRDPVQLRGKLKDPLRLREALTALHAVVASDYRYVPKDRTQYAAYVRMKKESAGLGLWQAQRAYFSWLLRNDPLTFRILDPIITVHPDQVLFEIFSKDEGTYAKLAIDRAALDLDGPAVCGTTNIDFSEGLLTSLQQLRSYRETHLDIARDAVKVQTAAVGEVLEKQIRVPDSWVRGFLQVQSAATLPRDVFSLAAIDLYNLLRYLRMHGDKKGKRRGLRIELVPGEKPRLVLEPWEVVLSCSTRFQAKAPKIVRVWGRRRLMLLRSFLPFVHEVEVHLLGSGLPSFWVLRADGMTLTLGLTGFTQANWSQAISFDLLLPRKTQSSEPLEKVLTHLGGVWFAKAADVGKATGLKGAALVEALQLGCQQGKLMYDLAADVYRLRPLTDVPLDLERLEYRNQRERSAHDLLVRRGAVKTVTENRIAGTGVELTGKVIVEEDKREYRPQLLLGDEGQVLKAECTCPFFRKQGLKGGPCTHLIALRMAFAEQELERQKGQGQRTAIQVETRTFSKRDAGGEEVVQLSLQKQLLKMRWGRAGKPQRLQTLRFNSVEEARGAYFARLDELNGRGFLDATAS
jgi:hypothetical protein